jgi:antitoxin YefM
MRVTSASEFRKNLATELDRVVDDHTPLIVTRGRGKPPAVLVSLEDFSSWQETEYLLRSPENARRLRESIAQAERGEVVVVDPFPP